MMILMFVFIMYASIEQVWSCNSSKRTLKCYYCVDKCENPTETISCYTSKGEEYNCISSYTVIGDEPVEQKGCVSRNDAEVVSNCEFLNTMEGSSCFFCETDLCNSVGSLSFSIFYSMFALQILHRVYLF